MELDDLAKAFTAASAFDPRVKLHLDPRAVEFYIEFHEESPAFAIDTFRTTAARRGYREDVSADWFDNNVPIDDTGTWRLYLIPHEPICDVRDSSMPDLTATGSGPYSGFMEAVTI